MQTHRKVIGRFSAAAARHPWRVIVVWVVAMAASPPRCRPQALAGDDQRHLPFPAERSMSRCAPPSSDRRISAS